jgi:hypothetical protein
VLRRALLPVVIALAAVAVTRAEILVSNIGTNFAGALPSAYEPEEVSIDDARPCVAQLFGLPEDTRSFWLTNVVLSVNHSSTGAVKAVLTLWSSIPSPGSSATPGLPMPERPLHYLATARFKPGTDFNGNHGFTPQQPVAIKAGQSYWIVLTYEEESRGAFAWWSMNRHASYSYKEDGPGALYSREQRNTPNDDYLPNYWLDSGIKVAAAIAIEGTPAPHLSIVMRADSRFEIQVRGPSGQEVRLESSENLEATSWQPRTTAILEDGRLTVVEEAGSSPRFYRLR